ncbi:MAG TPA: hypothetical protein VMF69_11080 [Gemmataceae bacterium]|nr:hypothetical protein [Gemmataceae bacterium]
MPIRFDCPNCKANYEVADDLAGKMIMCRVCKKRGPVRSLTAPAVAAAAGRPATDSMSRRNFLPIIGLFLASVGAVATGALLARQPWDQGRRPPEDGRRPPEDGPGGEPGKRRRGPPRDDDKKDGKEGAV